MPPRRRSDGGQLGLIGGDELTGEVLGLVYADRSTGFGVIELRIDGSADLPADPGREPDDDPDRDHEVGGARCAGPLADLVEGQVVRLVGAWRDHPRYGETFEVTFYEQETPTSEAGLRVFLSSERFELDGASVNRLIAVFGETAGWVIEKEPDRLTRDAGLEENVARRLHEQWVQGRAYADLVRLLEPARLPSRLVRSAFGRFGADAASALREDPYRLAEVDGGRFAHADALGRVLGVDPMDERRLRAAAVAAHASARQRDGHLYLTRQQCIEAAAGMLKSDPVAAASGLDAALDDGRLEVDEVSDPEGAPVEAIYTPGGLRAERRLASELARLLAGEPRYARLSDAAATDPTLTPLQADAVRAAFTRSVSVLTGGPGTGKTHAIRWIASAAVEAGLNLALCAPTGRAAKRIEELVGHSASTIHRLLEAHPDPEGEGFVFGYGGLDDERGTNRLPHDVVICDEVSMCDTYLAASLVSAVDDRAHLVLVGDPDQLPPVGPGDVLRDLITVGETVPAVRLTEVHRQAAESRIIRLAHAVNAGEVPDLPGVDGDVFMAEERSRRQIVPRVVEAVSQRIPEYFGVDASDVQVIAPIYRGDAGVDALNAALKAALNPAGGPVVAGIEEGDRVMQTRNDTERDVSNGDVGHVVDVDPSRSELRVRFPRGEVVYDAVSARDLTHAWAMTVHKSQGGEWPVIVFVCDRAHRAMLWRNLAYTAITRAQRALIIVGQRDAIRAAAAHDRPRNRQTLLAARLRAAVAG